jgi:hypothetical protein
MARTQDSRRAEIINSPYRDITTPLLDYIRDIRCDSPRDAICLFIPEYVVGHWWEQLLHNQSAPRLKARLLFTPGVTVASVPDHLNSSHNLDTSDAPSSGATPSRNDTPPATPNRKIKSHHDLMIMF